MNRQAVSTSFFIASVAALLFMPFLGQVHLFDWDEINFAECAREMIVSNNYSTVQIGFLPFWEKPPLFIWMQAVSMKIFGDIEFAARFPNAICGIITLISIYVLGRRIYDEKFARLWAIAFAGSLLPAFYFHSGIIDPWFNYFIFLGIYHFAIYTNEFPSLSTQKLFHPRILASALFLALAVLTKGPVALLIFGLCFLCWRIRARKKVMSWQHFTLYAIVALSIPGTWFLYLAASGNGHLVVEFISYQLRLLTTEDAGHGGSFFYHWIILLLGCFPASVFAIQALVKSTDDTPFEKHMLKWMRILFWVVLILFSVVKTKIIHYSSLCYFPLTYLAAYAVYKLSAEKFALKKWMFFLLYSIGTTLTILFIILPFIDLYKQELINGGWIKDQFAVGNLQANASWRGWEWMTGILLGITLTAAYILFRKKNFSSGAFVLFGGTVIAFTLAFFVITPRVEEYSQGAAIAFWKEHAKDGSYLETIGYKSYAHYFYGNLQPDMETNPRFVSWHTQHAERLYNFKLSKSENEIAIRREWMLNGPIDKPAYFLCKNTFRTEVEKYYPHLRFTGERNGFVSWERLP